MCVCVCVCIGKVWKKKEVSIKKNLTDMFRYRNGVFRLDLLFHKSFFSPLHLNSFLWNKIFIGEAPLPELWGVCRNLFVIITPMSTLTQSRSICLVAIFQSYVDLC